MKIIVIIVSILILIVVVFQVFSAMATNKTETQAYTVAGKNKDFEIRFYPAATMAMISSSTKSYKDLGSSGFRKLAGYIFGGNSEKKQIAMTSPVHMNIGESNSTMAFVLPAAYNKSNLPKPNDAGVSITTSEPEYVAVIQFSGFASNDDIAKHKVLLEELLKEKNISYYGNFRYLGYNPPFQLFGRRNEVIVAVNEKDVHKIKE